MSLQCTRQLPRTVKAYTNCLRNRTVVFIGDSTTKLWFAMLTKLLNVTVRQGRPGETGDLVWHSYARAQSNPHDLHLEWMPHEHPFAGEGMRRHIHSVSSRLKEIGPQSNAIIIIHWYLHFARFLDPNKFREHVQNAKAAIVELLKRSPDVYIFIKGPHAITFPPFLLPYDFIRRYMEEVLYEEFRDLQNSVYYLQFWDMTVGTVNKMSHPPGLVNTVMIHNFLSFACSVE